MSLQPRDTKPLIALAAAAVMLAVIVVATTLLVRGHTETSPQISAASGSRLERVSPSYWCDPKMEKCTPRFLSMEEIRQIPPARLAVPIGGALSVSVPTEISAHPWALLAEYATPAGIAQVIWIHQSGTAFTQILKSTPNRVLLTVELSPFSAVLKDAPEGVESDQGDILFRAHYAIDTTPDGFTVADETPLPAERG